MPAYGDPMEGLKKAEAIKPGIEPTLGMMPMLPGGLSGAIGALRNLFTRRAPTAAMEVVEAARPARQVVPMADDVAKMMQQMRGNLSNVPSAGQRMQPLGQRAAEFTPRGGEAAFNAGQPRPAPIADPIESIYQRILAQGGRAVGGGR